MQYVPSRYSTWTTGVIGMVLAAALGLAGVGCDREPAPGPGNEAPSADASDNTADADASDTDEAESAATEAVRDLSDQLNQVVQADGDAAPLIGKAHQLTEQYPNHAAAHRLLGQALLTSGEHQPAYAAFEKSLELEPNQTEVHLLAGTLASKELDDVRQAERHYAEAVSLEPTNGRARLHLAQAMIDQQRYNEARHELLVALKHDAAMHEAHALMADLYAKQNKTEPGLTHIRKAINLLPEDDELSDEQLLEREIIYIRRRAMLLRRDFKPEAAISVLRDLPVDLQYDPGVSEEIALCWAMMQQPIKGAEHFEQSVKHNPNSVDAAVGAASWYLRAEQPDKARKMLNHLQRIRPRHPKLTELREQLAQKADPETSQQ